MKSLPKIEKPSLRQRANLSSLRRALLFFFGIEKQAEVLISNRGA